MTSTNVFSGNFAEKPSSRVLKPPGGGNSNIFGDSGDSLPCNKNLPQTEKSLDQDLSKESTPKLEKSSVIEAADKPSAKSESKLLEQKSNPAQHNDTNKSSAVGYNADEPKSYKHRMQGSFNPITGESYSSESKTLGEPKPINSISVRQPPGGASTKLW